MKNIQNTSPTTTKEDDRISELEEKVEKLEALINWYQEQFRLKAHQKFGRSSEKQVEGQLELSLFNEAETETIPAEVEEDEPGKNNSEKTKRKKRASLDPNLPTETMTHSLPLLEQACLDCGNGLHVMKTEIRHEIEIIPAQVKVIKHEREIYSCRTCEREAIHPPIVSAPIPNPVIPKSMASPSAVAHILTQKYMAGLPLYRIEEQLRHTGIHLSRQTLSNWVIQSANRWIEPIYKMMLAYLLDQSVLHADETTLQVLQEDGRDASSKSYMWLYCTGRTSAPCALYDYQTTRSSKHPQRILQEFEGILHTDGYAGYNNLSGVTLSGCWAHMRRKFVEAQKAAPPSKGGRRTFTDEAIDRIGAIYKIEKEITRLEEISVVKDTNLRQRVRQEKSFPLVEAFFAWLKKERPSVVPKSNLGKAITYALNQEKKLLVPFFDGRLDLDNNRAERLIKPFVIGRKNWLFSNTPKGAKASAMIYSLIVTAKENGLNVFQYLVYLFETLPNINLEDEKQLHRLLPWSEELPYACRLSTE